MAAQVPSRLYRSRSQKMLAGVCGGLGEYFDVDPVLIRLLFVVTAFISGVGILAYIVLWIVVPFEGDDGPRLDSLRRDFDDFSGRVRDYVDPPRAGSATGSGRDTPSGSASSTTSEAPSSDVGAAASPSAGPAAPSTTHPFEGASMTSDTAAGRLPRSDDPATADDLTLEPETAGSRGTTSASDRGRSAGPPPGATPDTPPLGTPAGTPYGAPYGPPPGTPYDTTPGAPYGSAAGASFGAPFDPPPVDPAPAYAAAPAAPADRRRRRQHWAGAILIVLGMVILGNNLGLLWWVEPEYILPLLFVAAGAWLLFGRGRRG